MHCSKVSPQELVNEPRNLEPQTLSLNLSSEVDFEVAFRIYHVVWRYGTENFPR